MLLSILVSIVAALVSLPVDLCFGVLKSITKSDAVVMAHNIVARNINVASLPTRQSTDQICPPTKTSTNTSTEKHSRREEFKILKSIRSLPVEMLVSKTEQWKLGKSIIDRNFHGVQEHVPNSLEVRPVETVSEYKTNEIHAQVHEVGSHGGSFTGSTSSNSSIDKFNQLKHAILQQRNNLYPNQRQEFDRDWGFSDDNIILANQCNDICRVLDDVYDTSIHEINRIHALPEDIAGLEIIHLFVNDMLGRNSSQSKIFQSLTSENFVDEKLVSLTFKWVAGIFLILLLLCFMLFTILRSNQRGLRWQQSFILSCVLQCVIEIVFNETTTVLWINYGLPSLITKKIVHIKTKIEQTILALIENRSYVDSPFEKSVITCNVPDYLFVSYAVAKAYPHLLESEIVLSYKTPTPGKYSGWQWKQFAPEHHLYDTDTMHYMQQASHWFIRSFIVTTIITLHLFGSIPLELQGFVVQCVQPAITGSMALFALALHWIFANSNYTVVFFVIVFVVVFVIYRRYNLRKIHADTIAKQEMESRIQDIETQARQDADKARQDDKRLIEEAAQRAIQDAQEIANRRHEELKQLIFDERNNRILMQQQQQQLLLQSNKSVVSIKREGSIDLISPSRISNKQLDILSNSPSVVVVEQTLKRSASSSTKPWR